MPSPFPTSAPGPGTQSIILEAGEYLLLELIFFFKKHSSLDKHPQAPEHSSGSSTNEQLGTRVMCPPTPRRTVMLGQVRSGPTLRPWDSQPGRFIYAAVSSLCPGNGLGALDPVWRRSDFLLRAVGSR